MPDSETVARQGPGWSLRECWKREPVLMEDFLLKQKDFPPRIIFQYAAEKMTPKPASGFARHVSNGNAPEGGVIDVRLRRAPLDLSALHIGLPLVAMLAFSGERRYGRCGW